MILKNRVSNKLKNRFWGSKVVKFCQKPGVKKVDGSWFFDVLFCHFGPKSELYGFIEKQAPQKALCLGPDTALGIYWNLSIFYVFYCIWGLQYSRKKRQLNRHLRPTPPKSIFYFIANPVLQYHLFQAQTKTAGNSSRPNLSTADVNSSRLNLSDI
jgi:hypothetical protein